MLLALVLTACGQANPTPGAGASDPVDAGADETGAMDAAMATMPEAEAAAPPGVDAVAADAGGPSVPWCRGCIDPTGACQSGDAGTACGWNSTSTAIPGDAPPCDDCTTKTTGTFVCAQMPANPFPGEASGFSCSLVP